MSNPQSSVYLTTGEPNFSDLCGGRSTHSGLLVPLDSTGKLRQYSVAILGYAGTGKTTLAAQLLCRTVSANVHAAESNNEFARLWPANSIGMYYTMDQDSQEIGNIITHFKWFDEKEIILCPERFYDLELDKIIGISNSVKIVVKAVPYAKNLLELRSTIKDDTQKGSCAGRVKIVVIDAINSLQRTVSGNVAEYTSAFRQLLRQEKEGEFANSFCSIATMEIDPKYQSIEEYLPDCVILLGRESGKYGVREIEIRKARHQEHLIGRHDMRIDRKQGIKVFPSLSSRAWDIPSSTQMRDENPSGIDFGDDYIQTELNKANQQILEGSATLLWGEQGTGKTELCVRFMGRELVDNQSSGVLFVTTKVDPHFVFRLLVDDLMKRRRTKDRLVIVEEIQRRLKSVDAIDPFKSHAMTFAEVVDLYNIAEKNGNKIRRAVVFGLGLLEESSSARDEQWRFVSVLSSYLRHNAVTLILVDWPTEGVNPLSDVQPTASSGVRPRASKLCSNEIYCQLGDDGRPKPSIVRINYSSVSGARKNL